MKIQFQKMGMVKVGTGNPDNPDQMIFLQDPIGEPINLVINLKDITLDMSVLAHDDRNSVVRDYPILLDEAAQLAILGFFAGHVRRLAKEQYNEFKDLVEVK